MVSIAHAGGRKQRNSYLSKGLAHLRISESNKTISEARENLQERISRSTTASNLSSYSSLLCLVDELTLKRCIPLHVAFDECAAKLEERYNNHSTRVQFKDLPLQKNILILTCVKALIFCCKRALLKLAMLVYRNTIFYFSLHYSQCWGNFFHLRWTLW